MSADDIEYMGTSEGVHIRFPRPVAVEPTKWGTRIALTELEAQLLHHRLSQYLLFPEPLCTCSRLVHGTDYRCKLHPDNQALSFDERMEFEQKFDKHIEETKK